MTAQIIVQREVLINAPLAHVWQLVATEEGLRQWWGNRIELEPKAGGRCAEWRAEAERAQHWQGVVTIYTPPHELMLTLRAQAKPADTPEVATILIALEARGEQTRVHVTHRAFGPSTTIAPTPGREAMPHPAQPHEMPMAQLTRPAPGARPDAMPAPTPGRMDTPEEWRTRQRADALTLAWQQRLTSLVAAVAPTGA